MRNVTVVLLIVAATAGCLDWIFGPDQTREADYSIACDPPVVALPRGSAGTVSCTVRSSNGFANDVTLSASSVPAGVTVAFTPATVTPPKDSSVSVFLQLSIAGALIPNSYSWSVVGVSGSVTREWNGKLDVMEKTAAVHVVYLIPSDRQQRDEYVRRLEGAIRHVQIWYLNALESAKTFAISQPTVAIYPTQHPASWYSSNNNASDTSSFRFSNNVQADGLTLAGARVDDPDNIWVFYIDAPAAGGQTPGTGARGIAVIDGTWLARLGQADAAGNCSGVGILAHELGHAFANLRDLPDCGTGGISCPPYPLMGNGAGRYPNAVLRPDEKEALNSRRAFLPLKVTTRSFGCTQLTSSDLRRVSLGTALSPNEPPRRCADGH